MIVARQAGFIGDLQCDIIVLAFAEYLDRPGRHNLGWLTGREPRRGEACSLENLKQPATQAAFEAWQPPFYLFLHLLPVQSAAQLLHQFRRWEVAAGKDAGLSVEDKKRLRRLLHTLTLYLDMHDAKFEGDTALLGCEGFVALFENDAGFRKVFPEKPGEGDGRRLPRRGLREIMRYGHLPVIEKAIGGHKVDDDSIARMFAMEAPRHGGTSDIARLQERREDLHAAWVKSKGNRNGQPNPFGPDQLKEYCRVLVDIIQHRQDTNFVNLTDHVRLHRLIMAVMGRLADYAGLFERDLYFATLALLHTRQLRPGDVFKPKGEELFYKGQIISALTEHKRGRPEAAAILAGLAEHFPQIWDENPDGTLRMIPSRHPDSVVGVRNERAHLGFELPLTASVNKVRQLMAYDRKLKNAVSKSILDLLDREGIELSWKMDATGAGHSLTDAVLRHESAKHLGEMKLPLANKKSDPPQVTLDEPMHSKGFVAMLAFVFGGSPAPGGSIAHHMNRIDWEACFERRGT